MCPRCFAVFALAAPPLEVLRAYREPVPKQRGWYFLLGGCRVSALAAVLLTANHWRSASWSFSTAVHIMRRSSCPKACINLLYACGIWTPAGTSAAQGEVASLAAVGAGGLAVAEARYGRLLASVAATATAGTAKACGGWGAVTRER